jgi:hypothetical protein
MSKKILGFLYFMITVAILIAALKIINWVPMAIQTDTIRRYNTIEEVKAKLKIKKIYVPSYFPQNLIWPPSEILAQTRPFTAIVMEFRHAKNGDIALIISQAASADFTPYRKINMQQIKESVSYHLKGRDALLEVGICKNDEPCSQISWNEDSYRIIIMMKSGPIDLLMLAESMVHQPF